MNRKHRRLWPGVLALPLALSACDIRFGDGGRIDLRLTDAPIDGAAEVVIAVEAIELRTFAGERETFSYAQPRRIDLLELANGRTTLLLADEFLPADDYESIRLRLRSSPDTFDSYVRLDDGRTFALYVPDGAETGLRVATDFTIDDGDSRRLTIDFDVRRSLREPDADNNPQAYRLVPSLRVVEDRRSGDIEGRIAAALINSSCVPAVYVYSGRVTPDDIGGTGAQPLTSSRVFLDSNGHYVYTAGFLPEAEYTVALSCEAGADDPERNDAIDFISDRVTVTAEETATLNF